MAQFDDLSIQYEPDATDAILVFDGGTQLLKIDVTPVAPEPVEPLVTTAAELVAALKTPGRYRLASGIYAGNFTAAADGVTITAAADTVVTAKEPSLPCLTVKASNFSWTGGTFGAAFNETIVIGSYTATTVAEQPDGVYFADCELSPDPVKGGSRGFAIHACNVTIERCRVLNYFRKGQEVQGIWICNGPGPFTILDCYVEGAGENLMTGGASINIPECIPSDLTVRGCTFYKPDKWRTDGSTVKNLLELKAARRVLIENNVFDNCWKAAQAGNAIAFTARNADNQSPWVTVEDVVFRHNVIRHSTQAYGINVLGTSNAAPTLQMQRLTIEDNLFEHCTGGIQVGSGVTESLTIARNTFPAVTGTILMFADCTIKTNLTMTDNVSLSGVYGLFASCTGASKGEPALKSACSAYVFVRNVLERSTYKNSSGQLVAASIPWPAGNTVLPPNGITWGPDYTYDANGDAVIDAGWPGVTGPAGVEIEVQTARATVTEADAAAAIEDALESFRDDRTE